MGLAKANELLLLGQKIDADTAVNWNICSKIIDTCSNNGDPFDICSIGSLVCKRIDEQLLSLPVGDETSKVSLTIRKCIFRTQHALCFLHHTHSLFSEMKRWLFRFLLRWYE